LITKTIDATEQVVLIRMLYKDCCYSLYYIFYLYCSIYC